ncbi:MAG: nucleoside-triphosphatase [Methanolinea sp.]|nr:nucleoside-triphosphatase [Methanolinea sp.]
MKERTTNILITGPPGCGKTTLIKNIISDLSFLSPVGFYTEEIREGKMRVGFRGVSLDGRTFLLARSGFSSRFQVGKYGVDKAGFESFLATISFQDAGFVVIDEIGKMECISGQFCHLVEDLLSSEKCLLATIASRGTPFIEAIRQRDDVEIHLIDRKNHMDIAGRVKKRIRALIERT